MPRRIAILAVTAALGAVGGALPTAASAEVKWRCTATPLSGTLLGQPLDLPSAGSRDGECTTDSTLPTLQLPDPLASLLKVNVLNGVTATSDQGVFAGAGLADLSVGSLPIQLPDIPIPDALKQIQVSLPGFPVPVATVDLTPAIDAIRTLPSKNLLDAGALYSNVVGTCQDGKPVITGASRVLNASVLGLPVDASKTVDSAINLVDTSSIALDTLDLSLAKVTLLGGTLNVGTGAVLNALKPILATLPPLQIPPSLARVKLTASSQEMVDGLLVQRALRAQISLAGTSLADLSIGEAAVGAGTACAPAGPPDAPAAALECTKRKLALIDVLERGKRVRLFGAADKSLVGKTVKIVFQATGKTVARVKVRRNGGFTTTAPLPPANVRFTNRARYIARAGNERSLNLKLHRRMLVDKVSSLKGRVRISGHITQPLADPVKTVTLKRRVTCKTLEVVKRFKPQANGRFTVTVKSPKNLAATVYRLQTRVRTSTTSPKLYPTFTLPRAVDL